MGRGNSLLPLREKVARPKAETDEGEQSPSQAAAREDRFLDHQGIGEDVGIPEPKDGETFGGEEGVTLFIAHALGMLRAISFDDDAMLETYEVRDVWRDRRLPTKLDRG